MRTQLVAAIAAAATLPLLAVGVPTAAAAPTANCADGGDSSYPPANTRAQSAVSRTAITRGNPAVIYGAFGRNNCAIAGAKVALYKQSRAGAGYVYNGVRFTNARGQVAFVDRPGASADYVLLFPAQGDFGRSQSPKVHVSVTAGR